MNGAPQELIFYEPYTIWYHPFWHNVWFLMFVGCAVGALCIVGIFFIIRSHRRSKTPWQQALHELNNLQENVYIERGTVKEFYSQLTDILKKYGIARFNLAMQGVTDTEFVQKLKESPDFPERLTPDLDTLYEGVLTIKFGHRTAQKSAMGGAKTAAQRIIKATIPPKNN